MIDSSTLPAFADETMTVRVTVNGAMLQLAEETTLASAIASLNLVGKRFAVERNGEVVPRSQLADTRVADGDRIEVVVAVGGG